MSFDTVIQGGRVMDPATGLDGFCDVGVAGGRIGAIAPGLDTTGAQIIAAAGKIVSPGFIDPHVHIYGGIGIVDPDTIGVHQGVTTLVDLGGAGTATFEHLRELVLPKAKTSIYSVIFMAAGGVAAFGFGTDDTMQIEHLDLHRLFKMVDDNRDIIKGLKSAVSVALGAECLALAQSIAHSAGLPFVLHLGEFDDYVQWYQAPEYHSITAAMLDRLRKGDLITHCYTPEPGRMFDEAGALLGTVRAMIDRGVYLDLGHSSHGFSVEVARLALAHGIRPHTLGSDLHVSSVGPVMRSLADVMSKMLALGIDLYSVVRMVTASPAAWLQITDRAGALRVGMPADVTVFEVEKGEYAWMDSHRTPFSGRERIVPTGCLKAGTWYPARMDLADVKSNRNVAVWKTGLPPATEALSPAQRSFLGAVADVVAQREQWDQIELHYAIEAQRERMGLPLREGVRALHLALYGKLAGQQVAWCLARQKRDFVLDRLKTIAAGHTIGTGQPIAAGRVPAATTMGARE